MINIREAVEGIITTDYDAREGLIRGILNLSQYARSIQKEVALYTKKDVGIQSIVVTLARLEKKLYKKGHRGKIEIKQLAVQSPIVQLVYLKNRENLEALTEVIQKTSGLEDVFFPFQVALGILHLLFQKRLKPL